MYIVFNKAAAAAARAALQDITSLLMMAAPFPIAPIQSTNRNSLIVFTSLLYSRFLSSFFSPFLLSFEFMASNFLFDSDERYVPIFIANKTKDNFFSNPLGKFHEGKSYCKMNVWMYIEWGIPEEHTNQKIERISKNGRFSNDLKIITPKSTKWWKGRNSFRVSINLNRQINKTTTVSCRKVNNDNARLRVVLILWEH